MSKRLDDLFATQQSEFSQWNQEIIYIYTMTTFLSKKL